MAGVGVPVAHQAGLGPVGGDCSGLCGAYSTAATQAGPSPRPR